MTVDYTRHARGVPMPERPTVGTVVLSKAQPAVALRAQGTRLAGSMQVNLGWCSRPGRFGRRIAVDLDLGCLYELTDGRKGVVQALDRTFASSNPGEPLITLDGDDRDGADGENLRVDLSRWAQVRRVLVFAYIYSGTPRWSEAHAMITMYAQDGSVVKIPLNESDDRARSCAIALLEQDGRGDLVVRREMRYLEGAQQDLDEAYGWGMRWTPGKKD